MLLTIEQVAERLGCSDAQVRILIRNGDLPYINIGAGNQRRCTRVASEALDAFIAGRQSERPQPRRASQPKPQREWV